MLYANVASMQNINPLSAMALKQLTYMYSHTEETNPSLIRHTIINFADSQCQTKESLVDRQI